MENSEPRHIGFIFIDGLGAGIDDERINPCTESRLFNNFSEDVYPKRGHAGGWITTLDAALGIPGLPQSATGQSALFTGLNIPALLGRHLQGFPNEKIRRLLARGSLLEWFKDHDGSALFINAFRPPFFDYLPHQIIRYLSVTSICNLYADLPFLKLQDIRSENSVYHDLTNRALRERGYDVPEFEPEQAGRIIARAVQRCGFVLFEYFNTDRAGHSLDREWAVAELHKLERFLLSLCSRLDFRETLLVVASDHGNIEQIDTKGHTRNPVQALMIGAGSDRLAHSCRSINDIAPALMNAAGKRKKT